MVRASDEAEGKVSGEPWVTVGVLPHFGPVGSASSLSDGAPSVGDNRVSPHLDCRLMLCKETRAAPLRTTARKGRPKGVVFHNCILPHFDGDQSVGDSSRFAPLRRRSDHVQGIAFCATCNGPALLR